MALAHDRLGAGPPLVLIHPLGADRRVWEPVLERLAAEREVIALDLPGFGGSPALRGPAAPADLARSVATFLGELGLERADVAGNSLGGWVALELGLAASVRSVIAIAPAGLWAQSLRPKPGIARRLARAAVPMLGAVAATTAGRRVLLAGVVAAPQRVPAAAAEHLVRSYASAPGFDAVNAAMRAGRFAALAGIRVPVTLAWCDHDRLVAPPALPPRVHTRVLSGCGHIPMWDDPEQVADLLLGATARAVAA